MAPNDHLLQSLCREPETLVEAQTVLRLAQTKTGPGSGHELGPHTTGLPAICAHIATQRLKNGDVSRKNAQIASCLKASDFEKAFHIVQAAIGGSRGKSGANGIYEDMVQKYTLRIHRDRLLSWTRAVERALLQSDCRVSPDDLNVKCAIFFWVSNAITGKNITTAQAFADDNNIPQKSITRLLNKIGSTCSSVKARIQDENQITRSSPSKVTATSRVTPRRSPTKTPLRALPSRDSPQKRKLIPAPLDQVESDIDMLDIAVPETPTKRRKVEPPSNAIQRISPSKPILAPTPSSSRVTLDIPTDVEMTTSPPLQHTPSYPSTPRRSQRTKSTQEIAVVDPPVNGNTPHSPLFSESDESDDADPLPPRRFRPVYFDHKQWYSRDGRLNRIWKQGMKHKQNLMEMYGHPLEQSQAQIAD